MDALLFDPQNNSLKMKVKVCCSYFLLLLLGESGLGKSTLLNSLFLTDLYTAASFPTTEEKLRKTTEVLLFYLWLIVASKLQLGLGMSELAL